MVAGHPKFEPDRLFSHTAKVYVSSDVFTTEELANIMSPYATPLVDDGEVVYRWREVLIKKYSKLPGIRELHDFITVRHLATGAATMRVWQQLSGCVSTRNH